ncbi:MAG: glycogen debranching enzyme N-terminal domain-containing protein [Calditrichaceae bacterium]
MSYYLGREALNNLKNASGYEWLERNKIGLYSSSTSIGMNTRREHGLLVVPDKNSEKKIVVLSKFEESVFIENRVHEISTNQFIGSIHPAGYNYLEKFTKNPFPSFDYRIEDRLLRKTMFLMSDQPILVVRYELRNQGKPVVLVLKPFIADRYNTDLSTEVQGLNTDSYQGHRFVRWAPKASMPELYVYYTAGEFISASLWYHNFYYPNDSGKHNLNSEDLFNPGFFQITLKPYDTVDLFISTRELQTGSNLCFEDIYRSEYSDQKKRYNRQVIKNTDVKGLNTNLESAINKINGLPTISISTIENIHNLRDMMISVPGLFFINKNLDFFREYYLSLLPKIQNGLLPLVGKNSDEKVYHGCADLSLLYIIFGHHYLTKTGDTDFLKDDVLSAYVSIIESYRKGTLFNIYCDKDELVFAGDKNSSVSWIPLYDKGGQVLRYGKMLEINALWYNALRAMESISKKINKKRWAHKYGGLADKVKKSFNKSFVDSESNQFIDFINRETVNRDFRINQILPLLLPFDLVDEKFAQSILLRIGSELLTPYGLRSLSKNDDTFILKSPFEYLDRSMPDYYNGTIWPWTAGIYVEAVMKVSGNSKDLAAKLEKYFKPILELGDSGLLGYIPEAVNTNGYIKQQGIADYTPGLAGVVWAYYRLEKVLGAS